MEQHDDTNNETLGDSDQIDLSVYLGIARGIWGESSSDVERTWRTDRESWNR